jgi:hypothetical protein
MSGASANNSSDFVGLASTVLIYDSRLLIISLGAQTIQVSRRQHVLLHTETDTK